jgi:predicted nucleic acid-binding protein
MKEHADASVLIDTEVLLDYLRGEPRARRVLEAHTHRAITATTWLEVMAVAPEGSEEATRAFLRSFERLSIGEPIADEALRLQREQPRIAFNTALNWAAARINALRYVTTDTSGLPASDAGVVFAYRGRRAR